jgi:nicotinate-nucleotide adenylyltransferase
MKRIVGILGGTFDPIHYGHLRMAADVRTGLGLTEIRLIPAGNPPHRAPPVASGAERLAMTALGCAEFEGLTADGREIERSGPSYTLTTLESIHSEEPGRPLALLIGSDAFAALDAWHHWERLFTLTHFVVVERPGAPLDPAALSPSLKMQWERRLTTDPARLSRQMAGSIIRQTISPQPISASDLRAKLALGDAGYPQVRGLLPRSVVAYIKRKQLYRAQTG